MIGISISLECYKTMVKRKLISKTTKWKLGKENSNPSNNPLFLLNYLLPLFSSF